MRKRVILLSIISLLFIFSLMNGNFSISVAENQNQKQITSTVTETTSATTPAITITTSVAMDEGFSIIAIIALLFISPLFALLFLLIGTEFNSFGGPVPGFEGGMVLTLLLVTGIFYLLIKNRRKR